MGLGEPHGDGDARGPRCDISGEPSLESSRDTFLDSRDTFSECSRSPGKITAVASLHSASSASRCLSASVISAGGGRPHTRPAFAFGADTQGAP